MTPGDRITTLEELQALYGEVNPNALTKESARITPEYRALIEAAPFACLATAGPEGLDASPRGDAAPVVTVVDERTLHLPDRRGNNRLDSLRNIVRDPRVALLLLIPGLTECLRVNGRAHLSTRDEDLVRHEVQGSRPRSVIVIEVEAVYFQCARAVRRARLWEAPDPAALEGLPTPGRIMTAITDGVFDGETYDRELRERQARTMY